MKKIVLKYYSRRNLGDDMFIKIFCNYFRDCRVFLIANPIYVPANLGKNVKIHPFSYMNTFIGKVLGMLGDNKLRSMFLLFLNHFYKKIEKNADALVEIGGSIFMDNVSNGKHEIEFGIKKAINFNINSTLQNNGKRFVIGANLGPIYSESYRDTIKDIFKQYNHVCLRDYSSYIMVNELEHVQYAPDVIFLTKHLKSIEENKIVISVVNVCRHTTNKEIIKAYYHILRSVIFYFIGENKKVALVSFCKREGDEIAISRLLSEIPDNHLISVYRYKNNLEEILNLFANSDYVIASRFHSMILGILFDKPIFPISYNCKTENYLLDLNFNGKYAKLDDLLSLSLDEILFNYKKNIIIDSSKHKKYAENQFWGLRTFLNDMI